MIGRSRMVTTPSGLECRSAAQQDAAVGEPDDAFATPAPNGGLCIEPIDLFVAGS